jgi:outer membrane murein-binding lipoprotein Lpp
MSAAVDAYNAAVDKLVTDANALISGAGVAKDTFATAATAQIDAIDQGITSATPIPAQPPLT